MSDQLIGKELDAAVAQHIMGWTVIEAKGEDWFDNIPSEAFPIFAMWPAGGTAVYRSQHDISSLEFRPSESIEAAMQVVEKMRTDGWSFACTLYEGKLPYASFCKGTVKSSRNAESNSLSEAICLAALKAIQEKKQK